MTLQRVTKAQQKERTRAFGQEWARRVLSADLDEKVAKAYPLGGWDEYRATIERCGNPADQIANLERARVILQPKQLEFSAWARRLDTAPHIEGESGVPELGFGGARGPGKSFGIFAQTTLDDLQRYPGLKWLYLRKTGLRAREQLEDLIMAVLAHTAHTYTIGRLALPNNSFLIIGHFQTEKELMNYLGIEYDGITVEEATTLSARAHRALRQAARTSKPGWRPRIYNSTNPLGIGHKDYKKHFIDHERKYKDVDTRTRKFIFATIDDNLMVNADYRGTLDALTGVERRAYRDGDWDVSAGAYFDQWRHDVHVVPPITPLKHWDVWASMDYGFNHWNVIHLHCKNSDGITYTFDELCSRKRYPDEIVPDFRALLATYGLTIDSLKKFYAGTDVFSKTGAAKKSVAEQYADLGIKITEAEMGPGSRVARAHHLQKLLGQPERDKSPTWFITEKCTRLIDTLPFLEVDPNNAEDVLKVDADEKGEGGDDAYDAACYGLFTGGPVKLDVEVQRYA